MLLVLCLAILSIMEWGDRGRLCSLGLGGWGIILGSIKGERITRSLGSIRGNITRDIDHYIYTHCTYIYILYIYYIIIHIYTYLLYFLYYYSYLFLLLPIIKSYARHKRDWSRHCTKQQDNQYNKQKS